MKALAKYLKAEKEKGFTYISIYKRFPVTGKQVQIWEKSDPKELPIKKLEDIGKIIGLSYNQILKEGK